MATIQGIYIALFGRPADPGGLAYWNGVTNNGSDLSKLIGQLTASQEYLDRFKGKTNAEIVTTIYQSLFGRAPDATGLDFFTKGLADGTLKLETLAINILDGAQGADKTIIDNKEKAADLFTHSLDTPAEIAAYNGNAAAELGRAFLTKVTDDKTTIPSQTDVDKAVADVVTPSGGQAPGGGGGDSGSTPSPAVASFDSLTKTLTIAANANVTAAVSGNVFQVSANGFSSFSATDVVKIVIGNGSVLHVSASLLNGITDISGAGTLDVTGVTLTKAAAGEVFEPTPGNNAIDAIYALTTAKFTVNGNEADTIKAIWDALDDRYGVQGYNNAETNTAFIQLGLRYVSYLDNGGTPFTDFTVKALNGRSQSMHDNLLGNLNEGAVHSRGLDALLTDIPAEYQNRPVYSGDANKVGGAEHDAVRAFDYAKGWDRPDYIDQKTDTQVDSVAINAGATNTGKLFAGTGNSADHFSVVRHEGAGIELGLSGRVAYGSVKTGSVDGEDGLVHFEIAGGSNVRFAYSIASTTEKTLADYTFKLLIDRDPGTGDPDYLTYTLGTGPASSWNENAGKYGNAGGMDSQYIWRLSPDSDTGAIKDDGGDADGKVTQNIENIGWFDNVEGASLAEGSEYDVMLEVWSKDGTTLIGSNHVVFDITAPL